MCDRFDRVPAAPVCRLRLSVLFFTLHFFLSLMWPIAISFHVEDLSFIDKSVNDGVGNGVVCKYLVKLPERDIGGRERPQFSVVPGADYLEE